jgi:hypothetical protein
VLVLVLGAVLLATILLLNRRVVQPSRSASAPTITSTAAFPGAASSAASYIEDLELSEVAVDATTQRLKGVARNTSARAYDNVHLIFRTVDDKGERGVAEAEIRHIEPHSTARFETQPLPVNSREYTLPPEITGTAK